MYSESMKKSLELNQRFVDSISEKELNELMSAFDNYQIEDNSWFCNFESLEDYLTNVYKTSELFEIFGKQQRKSIDLKKDSEKDLITGPFFIN